MAFTRDLPDAGGSVHLRVPLANLDLAIGLKVEPHHSLNKVVGEAEPPQHSEKHFSRNRAIFFDDFDLKPMLFDPNVPLRFDGFASPLYRLTSLRVCAGEAPLLFVLEECSCSLGVHLQDLSPTTRL